MFYEFSKPFQETDGHKDKEPTASFKRNPDTIGHNLDSLTKSSRIRNHSIEYGVISCGSKDLHVSITKNGEIISYIEKNKKTKVAKDTTACYRKLKEIVQLIANEERRDIPYRLKTRNSNMIFWAENTGSVIFNWHTTEKELYPKYCVFSTIISTAP